MRRFSPDRHSTPKINTFLIIVASLMIFLAGFGCSRADRRNPDVANPVQTSPIATDSVSAQSTDENIKFKQSDGSEKYSLKLKPDGAKLVDGADHELARLTLDGHKIKIKDAADQVLGYVVIEDGYWKLENAEQTKELYVLRLQDDGDFKLEDGSNTSIYRIKVRDYGYEIETPEKVSRYKVKVKDGKTSLRNANEETVLSTKADMTSAAMTAFGFDVLTPPQQAALAYAVNLTGGR